MPISMSNPFSSLINSSTFLTRYIIWKVGHLYIIKPTLEGTGHICSIYLQTWLLGWKATIFSCKRRCSKLTSSSVPLYKRCTFNFLVLADLVPSFYQVLKFSRSRRSLSLAADVDQATPSMCWRAYSHTRESPEGGGLFGFGFGSGSDHTQVNPYGGGGFQYPPSSPPTVWHFVSVNYPSLLPLSAFTASPSPPLVSRRYSRGKHPDSKCKMIPNQIF